MVGVLRGVLPVVLGVVLLQIANGLILTLVSLRMVLASLPLYLIGFVTSAFYVGGIIGCLAGDRLIRGVGHIRSFAGFAGILASATLLHALVDSPWVWIGLRLAAGFSLLGILMTAESWLNSFAAPETRGRILAFYMIAVYLSLGAGQLFLNLAPPVGFHLFVIGGILFAMALVPVAVMQSTSPAPIFAAHPSLRELQRLSPLGLGGCFCSGLIAGGFYVLGPVFAQGIGLDTAAISYFMAAPLLGGLLFQWPIGWLSDRCGRRGVLAAVAAATALCAGLIAAEALLPPDWLIAVALLFGGGAFVIYPLSLAHATDWSGAHRAVEISQGLIIAYSAGAVIAPLIEAGVMNALGPSGLFICIAAVAGGLCGFTLLRMTSRPPVPVEEQTTFIALPQTSPEVSTLDPRQAEPE